MRSCGDTGSSTYEPSNSTPTSSSDEGSGDVLELSTHEVELSTTTTLEVTTHETDRSTATSSDGNSDIYTTSTTDDVITTTPQQQQPNLCPDDFLQLTVDWCFHFKYCQELRMDFKHAQSYCVAMHPEAILPAVTSVEVTTALMLERTSKLGISPLEFFYIGLICDTREYHWAWLDGPDFDPSDAFFHDQRTSTEVCSALDPSHYAFDQFGTWQRVDRTYTAPLVVCAMRPMGYSPPVPVDAPCADQWTPLPGGYCYRLSILVTPMNLSSAEVQCKNFGGHLPAIGSTEQSDLIQAYLIGKGQSNGHFWLGLYCNYDGESGEGKRTWLDGSPYTYGNFLDENDDTETCNVQFVDTFMYNGALGGKWQKQLFNETLGMLMCSRPNPEPAPPTTSASTKTTTTRKPFRTTHATTELPPDETTTEVAVFTPQSTTEAPTESTTTGDYATTTDIPAEPTTEPIEPTEDVPTTSITIATTSSESEPTTTSKDTTKNPNRLTELEVILIISLATVVVIVILILLIYFLCKRIRKEQVQEIVANMQKRFSRSNTHVINRIEDEWEIKRQFVGIDYSRQLGRGAFGSVYLGRVFSGNIPELAVRTHLQLNTLKKDDDFVAVKTLHESSDKQATIEFLDEINIMKKIGFHERLVNILACVTQTEPLLLIVEYCANGDLLKFMRDRRMFMLKLVDTVGENIADRHSFITHRQQLMFGIQIAYGMEYLSQRGFVHRDLAARNILVDQNETCKIGDFGLCREVGVEHEQYISRGGRLPWKWMAPEALERFHFSVESDIWAFGVLLFEIITLGGNPYPDWPAIELLHRLRSGERMAKPDCSSEAFYKIMLGCWKSVPLSRLSFEKIRRKLAKELEQTANEDYYLQLDGAAKYYQETLEFAERQARFNSF